MNTAVRTLTQIILLLAVLTVFAPHKQRGVGRLWLAATGRTKDAEINPAASEVALFGTGIFWTSQHSFTSLKGVNSATVGYVNVTTYASAQPSYLSVSSGDGFTEAILVVFTPSETSYQEILRTFWRSHDATAPQKTQYQSFIWPLSNKQRKTAMESMEPRRQYVTTIVVSTQNDAVFYQAESVHQHFWSKLRLKLACLFVGTLTSFGSVFPDHLADGAFVADVTVKLVLLWQLWEGLELIAKGLGSFGWIPELLTKRSSVLTTASHHD